MSGLRLSVHMDISITRRITALPMVTTGRIGLWTAYLSAWDRGSTALRVFMATWITASIHITDTKARYRDVARRHSIISRRMRPATAAVTWSKPPATLVPQNTRCLDSAVVVDAARRVA